MNVLLSHLDLSMAREYRLLCCDVLGQGAVFVTVLRHAGRAHWHNLASRSRWLQISNFHPRVVLEVDVDQSSTFTDYQL